MLPNLNPLPNSNLNPNSYLNRLPTSHIHPNHNLKDSNIFHSWLSQNYSDVVLVLEHSCHTHVAAYHTLERPRLKQCQERFVNANATKVGARKRSAQANFNPESDGVLVVWLPSWLVDC